ncbi:hypothetical protein VHEMI07122 [[Torrubiella] hemipterigena]|uniref:Uncharacterized protein n=1 Tax=[Torrubiella] hemipterigena TaxID=1531966 RepID=A0A0A1TMB3_9HYPO|nr:hypothetical protein VHEMI07122 [[Torrubiella] hemipterigena]
MTSISRNTDIDKSPSNTSPLPEEHKDTSVVAPTSSADKLGPPNQPVPRVRPRTVIDEYNDKVRAYREIDLPDEWAPVDIVRAYVMAVLHMFYAVPRDEADAVAERWEGKRGTHFRALKSEEEFA